MTDRPLQQVADHSSRCESITHPPTPPAIPPNPTHYAADMAQSRPALYAAAVTGLGFVCLAVAAAAVGIPIWGYYEYLQGGWDGERGYFGPWKVCKQLNYNREVCGDFRFRPSVGVYISGILAAISCACLGVFCVLSIMQIAMISSREKVVMRYKPLVIIKLILAIAAGERWCLVLVCDLNNNRNVWLVVCSGAGDLVRNSVCSAHGRGSAVVLGDPWHIVLFAGGF